MIHAFEQTGVLNGNQLADSLHYADERMVAALVGADAAQPLGLRNVVALRTNHNVGFHLADSRHKRLYILVGLVEQMQRQAQRGLFADARQLAKLIDHIIEQS